MPSPKKPRKVRGKKRKVAIERIFVQGNVTELVGQCSVGQSLQNDEEEISGDGQGGDIGSESEAGRVKEEYEGPAMNVETSAKRSRCEIKMEY